MSTVTTPQRGNDQRVVTSAEQLRKGPGFVGGVSLVAEREIVTRLRSKSFLISSAILLVLTLISDIFINKCDLVRNNAI